MQIRQRFHEKIGLVFSGELAASSRFDIAMRDKAAESDQFADHTKLQKSGVPAYGFGYRNFHVDDLLDPLYSEFYFVDYAAISLNGFGGFIF